MISNVISARAVARSIFFIILFTWPALIPNINYYIFYEIIIPLIRDSLIHKKFIISCGKNF